MTATETTAEARENRLATHVGALALQNPILTASGTYGNGEEFTPFVNLANLGGVVTKSVTLNPTKGNPPPRVVETPGGMLNAIGLQNEGIDHFLADKLPAVRRLANRVIVNIAGKTVDEYAELARRLDPTDADALEVNISCPNVKEGGIAFGVDPSSAAAVTRAVRDATKKPVWIKLSPNVAAIGPIAKAVADAGADAVTVANTFIGMAVDIERRRPILANVTGGLSGPCVHPLALRLVWETRKAVSLPIVAVGGVAGVREVVGFLLAGASAVEVGTMNFVEPDIAERLVRELDEWLATRNETVAGLVGGLRL